MSFENIDLNITWGQNDQVWVSMTTRLGVVHSVPLPRRADISLEGLIEVISKFRRYIRQAIKDPDFTTKTGELLRDLVFGVAEIETLFHRTRGVASDQGRPLLIRIQAAPRIVAGLPWELMLDPEGGEHEHLTLAPDAHIARLARVRTYPVNLNPLPPPLKMLLILSSPPLSQLAFDIYQEKQALLSELRPLVERGLLVLDVEDRPTVENLRARIVKQRRGYHIVHYIGHAEPEGLLLEDGNGHLSATSPAKFNVLMRQCPELSLVFFAGCETAQNVGDTLDESKRGNGPMSDVEGERVLREHLLNESWPGSLSITELCVRDASQMVVGMQAKLAFRTERIFSSFFYKALVTGRSVADAISQARAATRDDEHVGSGHLDWAVPCLFLGGEAAEGLVDSNAPTRAVISRHKEVLKLDFFEEDQDFFARHLELRQIIDFLSGRSRQRLLWVTGTHNVGKQQLVSRALEEFEGPVLAVSVERLLDGDPIREISELVAEVLRGQGAKPSQFEKRWKKEYDEWWQRLIEDLVHQPIAIVLSDFDLISNIGSEELKEKSERLVKALRGLVSRRATAKLILIGNVENDRLFNDASPGALTGRIGVQSIKLAPLPWPDVRRWIRRNLPVLARYEFLERYFDWPFGDDFALWQQLAEKVAAISTPEDSTPDIAPLVEQIGASITRPKTPTKSLLTLGESDTTEPTSSQKRKEFSGLTVAIAGPFVTGREREFAEVMTAMARENDIGGRVRETGADVESSAIANLLPIPSPFAEDFRTSSLELVEWMEKAAQDGANIILADYGSVVPDPFQEVVIKTLESLGVLVLAAGGNEKRPSYPAWYPDVLAVGGLEDNGQLASFSIWDPVKRKPDIFARKHVRGSELEKVVRNPGGQGTSFSAYQAMAAAVLVWATDLSQTAAQVKEVLVSTAEEIPHGRLKAKNRPKALNLKQAIEKVRKNIIVRTLANGPLEMQELIVASGLGPRVTEQVLETLEKETSKPIRRFTSTKGETYELTTADPKAL